MNRFFILAVASFLSLSAQAQTSTQSSGGRVLTCDFLNAGTGRLLDRQSAPALADSRDPILFMFGYGSVQGTVRDTAGADAFERNLEVTLSYEAGVENGNAVGGGKYRVNQAITAISLADVTIDGPGFDGTLELRCNLVAQSADTQALKLLSTITYEYGNATAYGMCSGTDSFYCVDQLKQRAREDAVRQAEMSCQMKNGRADTMMPACYDSCNPFNLPPESPAQSVSCNSNCNVRCEIL